MAASPSELNTLLALVVFQNSINQELIRSVHVYLQEDWNDKIDERKYVFHKDIEYTETKESDILTPDNVFDVKQYSVGMSNGDWQCILVFDREVHVDSDLEHIPAILVISRNPKLAAIPSLANDLDVVFSYAIERNTAPKFPQGTDISRPWLTRTPVVSMLDLNSPAPSDTAGLVEKKHKRAKHKDVRQLTLEDLVKYFDVPIIEASKSLNVGLTVLKRKCRQFGIPRWPHRKIKSLDGLIHDLQEEAKRQEKEDEAAAMAVAKRQKMIESEKERIERKPFLDIQLETKKFRQDIFKRRYEAKIHEKSCQA